MKHSESVKEIFAALAEFQAEVEDPKMDEEKEYRTRTGQLVKLKYATLKAILKTVRPLLAKHGICLMQEARTENNKVTVSIFLLHKSGEWIESEPYSLNSVSTAAQEIGSATTYARRYSLSSFLGIGAEEDDDGNGAMGIDDDTKQPPQKQQPKPQYNKQPAQNQQKQQPKPQPPPKQAPQQQPNQQKPAEGFTPGPAVNEHGQPLISKNQANHLYFAAGNNAELLKSVMMNHGYVFTKDIEAKDYDMILNEINAKMAQLSGGQPK